MKPSQNPPHQPPPDQFGSQVVKAGDKVLATDPETGEQGSRTIEKVLSHDDDLYVLTVNGQRLTTTEDHPFRKEATQVPKGA